MIWLPEPTFKKVRSDSDEDEEEAHQRMMNRRYKMGKWKYSFFNRNNVVINEELSPTKQVQSPKTAGNRRGVLSGEKSPFEKKGSMLSYKNKKPVREKSMLKGVVV